MSNLCACFNNDGKTVTLNSLSFLRIVFMFLIFLEHYPMTPLRVGSKAVCFFFVLSGFVLSYGYGRKLQTMTYKNFIIGRVCKLYPLHWLLLPIGFYINRGYIEQTWYFIPANFLLLQSWIPDSNSYYSGNGLSWFLSTTLFLYIVFPYLWKICSRLSIRRNLFIFIILIAIRCSLDYTIHGDMRVDLLYISPAVRWMDFTVGIITFIIYKSCVKNNLLETKQVMIAVFSIILPISAFYATYNKPVYPLAIFWISYSCLICGSALVETIYKKDENEEQHYPKFIRIVNGLSNISFSFYLLHQIVILILFNHKPLNILNDEFAKFIIILTVCLVLAYISHHYFEKPISKQLRSLISRQ